MPLLPGYGLGINVRSSAAPAMPPTPTAEDIVAAPMSEAEETADEGTYFPSSAPEPSHLDNFSPGTSPIGYHHHMPETPVSPAPPVQPRRGSPNHQDPDTFGEAVFFQYGVVVFFGVSVSADSDWK